MLRWQRFRTWWRHLRDLEYGLLESLHAATGNSVSCFPSEHIPNKYGLFACSFHSCGCGEGLWRARVKELIAGGEPNERERNYMDGIAKQRQRLLCTAAGRKALEPPRRVR